jgi:PAS domain S-box-containing protein
MMRQEEERITMKTSRTGSEFKTPAVALRRRAEGIAREKAFRIPENMESLSVEAARQILHELRVHQIELEMQNEELRRTQAELDAARARYFDLYDLASVGYFTLSDQGLILEANHMAASLLGVAKSALVKQPIFRFILPEDQDIYYLHRTQLFETHSASSEQAGEPQACELRMVKSDGTAFLAHLAATAAQDADGEPVCRVVLNDITERKRGEAALQESEESYRNLFENAGEAIFVAQDGKLVFFNPTATRIIGYSAEELLSMPFTGFIHPDDRDMVIDRHYRRVKEEASPSIYPLRIIHRDGSVRWVELNTVLINWQGKPATLNFLNDITERKQAEEKLRESLEQLRRAVETTIQVLVMAVEMKDPYTASHQRRMTDLARTMATEMGLPPEKIEGLRIAGVIHDIGKIILPTEILSKPTKLSDIEFSMIKEHVRLGYDILKDVESPWPLAEIVLQHHERMDGSGYPRGLKGEEILIEARILAVADVVEAMASHRPYRPALGIGAALAEIEKNRGLLYDSHVVDTCLRVFREKGYQIEGT